MKNPKLIGKIVKELMAISKPVTIKIRRGFNDENCTR